MYANQAPTIFTITAMCRVFKVTRRAYYAWRQRRAAHQRRHGAEEQAMKQQLRTLHATHRGLYGVNRLTVLMKHQYPHLGRRRVYRFMRELQLQGETRRRKWKTTTPDHRPHGILDHVNRKFEASKPRELVVCDATDIPLQGGVAYLATALDVYSRKIVGWALDRTQPTALMMRALQQVLARGSCDAMICHSDQGTQYTSHDYQSLCKTANLTQSTGSVGDCYDNAMAEAFFATLKVECVRGKTYATFEAARQELSAYINDYYNKERLHSGIGYEAPNDMERSYAKQGVKHVKI